MHFKFRRLVKSISVVHLIACVLAFGVLIATAYYTICLTVVSSSKSSSGDDADDGTSHQNGTVEVNKVVELFVDIFPHATSSNIVGYLWGLLVVGWLVSIIEFIAAFKLCKSSKSEVHLDTAISQINWWLSAVIACTLATAAIYATAVTYTSMVFAMGTVFGNGIVMYFVWRYLVELKEARKGDVNKV